MSDHRESSSAPIVFAAVLGLFVLIVGIAAIGGVLYSRFQSRRVAAEMETIMMRAEVEQARAEEQLARFTQPERILHEDLATSNLEALDAADDQPITKRNLTITIDATGVYSIAGKALNAEELEAEVKQAVDLDKVPLEVVIRANPKANIKHAFEVLRLCERAGAPYSLTANDEPVEAAPTPPGPTTQE